MESNKAKKPSADVLKEIKKRRAAKVEQGKIVTK